MVDELMMASGIVTNMLMTRTMSVVWRRDDNFYEDDDVHVDVGDVCFSARTERGALVARRVKRKREGAARCSAPDLGGTIG